MAVEANHNPDILSCLANLSSDEVFTPPDLANRILDMLPPELWSNPKTKVLDPCCKSGVFLREIAKRMLEGEKEAIPDLQERIDHIFREQLYGIAITEITSLLSRRSLYCSKTANGPYSVTQFEKSSGNIIYNNVKHKWDRDGNCSCCGASKAEYNRGKDAESYAYEFIHLDAKGFKKLKDMKFDLIIGNPPYQLETASENIGAQAKPVYDKFVFQAIKLHPKYIVMITPSRWFAAGWGLEEFRRTMIESNKIKELHDFLDSSLCFPGVAIKGGVSYFLYDRDYNGPCDFYSHTSGSDISHALRPLQERNSSTLIRYNELVSVYRKIIKAEGDSFKPFSSLVTGRSPFGFNTNHHGTDSKMSLTDIPYLERVGYKYMAFDKITRNLDAINKPKVYISNAYGAGEDFPHQIINRPIFGAKGTICSGTYLMVGPFETDDITRNVISYMATKFFRALVMINKVSQHASYLVYQAVPIIDFSKPWTDEELYRKYGLTSDEIAFIESMIRPMDLSSDGGGDK